MTEDSSFAPDAHGLRLALDALIAPPAFAETNSLPSTLPEEGCGELAALEQLGPIAIGGARRLGAPEAFAHMDPPTPWITWALTLWNAALNQNLLHPDVAPVAREIEARVVAWLSSYFGMDGGHMTPGSTVANLTALWAARELKGITSVVASKASHVSVAKSAHILGLAYHAVPTDEVGRLDRHALPEDVADAALVLTAGTTNAGAIDDLTLVGRGAWTHVDAAWAGPLRFSDAHAKRLDGIEQADSVAVSAHKWLFQPKESGLVFFRDNAEAQAAISFGSSYLAVPNVGLLGSHGAIAVPLLATLLSWGRVGLARRIDRAMADADMLWRQLDEHSGIELYGPQVSGVLLWRPRDGRSVQGVRGTLPAGMSSLTEVEGKDWIRHVAANPNADINAIWKAIETAVS